MYVPNDCLVTNFGKVLQYAYHNIPFLEGLRDTWNESRLYAEKESDMGTKEFVTI
jgi:hypothetical protein